MTDHDIYELLFSVDNGYKLTEIELQQLSTVTSISWSNILELPHNMGLLKCVTNFDLRNTIVSDINALSKLQSLTSLDLSNNTSVSDISALSGLTGLTHLDLSNTSMSDISALSGLTGLINLNLSGTRVSDINALFELQSLTSLDLSDTSVSDISALSGLTGLTHLDLSGTRVSDINALSKLQSLTSLDLSDTSVSDINVLSRLSLLRTLFLGKKRVSAYTDMPAPRALISHFIDLIADSYVNNLIKGQELIELFCDKTRKIDESFLLRIRQLSSLFYGNVLNDNNYINVRYRKMNSISEDLIHHFLQMLINNMDQGVSGLETLSSQLLSNRLYYVNGNVSDISALSKLTSLTFLDLSCTSVSDISPLSGLTTLNSLDLSYTKVSDISNLSILTALNSLSLCHTGVSDISALSKLTSLTSLDLSYTRVDDISILSLLTSLMFLSIRGLGINDIRPLNRLKSLTFLSIGHTRVSDISALSGNKSLMLLDLSNTNISDISTLSGIKSLVYLNLSNTLVNDINALSGLTLLESLNISQLTLNTIPEFILDLKLSFIKVELWPIYGGVFINGLKLLEQPIEIFSEDRKLIRAYYRSQDKVPINECKVIFLGDAEAGKTHSIKRLLQKGEKLTDFDGNSTPGIEITVSSTTIEDTDIVVNYWDFGGQEIQHSMHRMFLTERTVYVVFLNARQDPLDERARYWIENINSFASGAPILLVINKIDQNDRPKFNEEGFRNAYKDQIRGVVRMSALNDEPDIFLNELEGNINRIINELPTASTLVPTAWKSLMENLRSTPEHYLTTDAFKEKCISAFVYDYDRIHNSLADLFQVIGVSFCYYKDRSTADYMLLNPKWLVNALYTIVTNSKYITQNGVITQNDLYDVLKDDFICGVPVKRVVPKWRYTGIEVNYILGVIRSFRLSYQLKDGSEFFPMLCDGNEKISITEAVSPNALHYVFRYIYLPANVMHRLIVEMQADVDNRYVWYSGVYLNNKEQNQVAYVYFEENTLHIYVESREVFYNPNEYFSQLQRHVREINSELGLSAKEYVTYREGEKETEIPIKKLKGIFDYGLSPLDYDEVLEKVIDYRVVAHRYENKFPKIKSEVLREIVASLGAMQNERMYYRNASNSNELEDFRNRFVSQQLRSAGYNCSDQQTGGESTNEKASGERDILIRDNRNQDLLIYEGLNLKYVDKTDISEHLAKLLENYNPQGLPYGVLTTYLECDREKYRSFIDRYKDYIKQFAPTSFECLGEPTELHMTEGQFLSCIEMSYGCGNMLFVIYHIVVRIAP